jgi:hypothetical protein
MAEAQKKVVVRLFDAAPVSGYLPAAGFVVDERLSVMDTTGRLISFGISDVKLVAYVRDFNPGDELDPERLGRKSFVTRPRVEGIWVRMTFRDGDVVEGLAAGDMTFLDSLVGDGGLMVTPPDARSNTQRIYVPRGALTGVEFLGVISRRKPTVAREPEPWLFGDT